MRICLAHSDAQADACDVSDKNEQHRSLRLPLAAWCTATQKPVLFLASSDCVAKENQKDSSRWLEPLASLSLSDVERLRATLRNAPLAKLTLGVLMVVVCLLWFFVVEIQPLNC